MNIGWGKVVWHEEGVHWLEEVWVKSRAQFSV